MKPYTGPPATLGSSTAAQVQLIVWCRDCRHKVEPDLAKQVARYGADLPVRDWVDTPETLAACPMFIVVPRFEARSGKRRTSHFRWGFPLREGQGWNYPPRSASRIT